mmetsp:Transcript_11312/g.15217  ORF Transcript_11312/g.15217 Transcript_11312/m.15217 type:complete len:93 (+) Transcript_11312:299-577(+)
MTPGTEASRWSATLNNRYGTKNNACAKHVNEALLTLPEGGAAKLKDLVRFDEHGHVIEAPIALGDVVKHMGTADKKTVSSPSASASTSRHCK